MYPNAHCSAALFTTARTWKQPRMSVDGGVDKEDVVYIYNGILLMMLSNSVVSDSLVTSRAVAHQAPLSMGFTRQEYWSGRYFLLQGVLLRLLHWQADSLPLSHLGSQQNKHIYTKQHLYFSNETYSVKGLLGRAGS